MTKKKFPSDVRGYLLSGGCRTGAGFHWAGARTLGRPDARTPGRSDARAFGCPGVQTPGRPDVRIRTSGRPDARTPTFLFFQFLRSSRRGREPGRAVEPAAPRRRGAGPRRDERKNCEKRTKNKRKRTKTRFWISNIKMTSLPVTL